MQLKQTHSEKRIIFNSGTLEIEGLLNDISCDKGVVVTHPHPLYGGDMMNNVVETLCLSYNKCGYSSLRFNFRGAGRSEGSYDNGKGEQEDLEAAIHFLKGTGIKDIDLAGYSFGSWVIALGIKKFEKITQVIMVSPPVTLFDYSSAADAREIKLVIAGSEDDIADHVSMEKALPMWNPDVIFKLIDGADHFYSWKTDDLQDIIYEFLAHRSLAAHEGTKQV